MVFDEYAAYYDLLYRDKDYAGEATYVDRLLKSLLGGDGNLSVVDLGCGTGKHAELLVQKGYRVHGIDQSEKMLEKARERARHRDGLSFSREDIRDIDFEQGQFDGAISLFHVMSYQTEDQGIEAVLRNVHRFLRTGGVFVFDCWYGPAVLLERPEIRVKRLEDSAWGITRIAEPQLRENRNIVEVCYDVFVKNKKTGDIREIRESHTMRYYFLPEMERMLGSAGLTLERAFEFMTEKELSGETWGSCFVARKGYKSIG